MNGFEEVQKRVKEITEARQEELRTAEERRMKYEEKEAELSEQLTMSLASDNPKQFSKLRSERDDMKTAALACDQLIREIQNKAPIESGEYSRLCKQIRDDLNERTEKYIRDISKASEAMAAIAGEYEEYTNEVNDLLYKIQHDLYRDADMLKGKGGVVIESFNNRKTAASFVRDVAGLIEWGYAGVRNYLYPNREPDKPMLF